MINLAFYAYAAGSNLPADNVDWYWVECTYRKGRKPVEDIAVENGVSAELIRQKAQLEGWTATMAAIRA